MPVGRDVVEVQTGFVWFSRQIGSVGRRFSRQVGSAGYEPGGGAVSYRRGTPVRAACDLPLSSRPYRGAQEGSCSRLIDLCNTQL